MNYLKIYDLLITKRQQNPILKNNCYCEKHHIIPKSLNGSDDDKNKVNLTAREHYIAHLLLVKIVELKYGKESNLYAKMIRAVTYFKTCNNNYKLSKRKTINFNSKIYESIRKEVSQNKLINLSKSHFGKSNGMFGRKRTTEEKLKISQTRIKKHLSKGKNNPMYGKPCYYKMTKEQYINWKSKIKNTLRNKHYVHLYHPITLENKLVPEIEILNFLLLGFIKGQYNKNRKSTKGMRKVCLPIKNAKLIWIYPNELLKYLNDGYVLWKNRIK